MSENISTSNASGLSSSPAKRLGKADDEALQPLAGLPIVAVNRDFIRRNKRLLILALIAIVVMIAAPGLQEFLLGLVDALVE